MLGERQTAKDWPGMIAIIERISALDGRPLVRAKFAYTVGVIYRDELHDIQGAKRSFALALTLDPSLPKPRRALDALADE